MEDLKEYLKVRKNLYLFIAKAFYKEADEAYFTGMKQRIPVLKTLGESAENNELINGCIKMEHFLDSITDNAKTIESLSCEFAFLFLGVMGAVGEASIPTSESVFLSAKKIAMQNERDEVLKTYYKYEMNVDKSFTEPEDHISAEMAFLAGMSQSAVDALEENDETKVLELFQAQDEFLNNHLLKWAYKFCDMLRVRAKSLYFQSLADILHGFLITDALFVKEMSGGNEGELLDDVK